MLQLHCRTNELLNISGFFFFIIVEKKLLSMNSSLHFVKVSKCGVNGRYFVICLSSVGVVLLYPHWFSLCLLTSVIPVDKISIASSNSLCDLCWEMRGVWNDLVSLCSFPVWWWWSLSKAIQCCKFLAGRKHFTVDTEVLEQTSHPLPQKA